MSDEMTIKLDGDEYVVRPEGEGFRVGRQVGDDVAWLETVDGSLLTDQARTALRGGDTSDESLRTALRGVIGAETHRGG